MHKMEQRNRIEMENKCFFIINAELDRKLSVWPKSEDEFLPSFDSALTDQEVCFPFRFSMLTD